MMFEKFTFLRLALSSLLAVCLTQLPAQNIEIQPAGGGQTTILSPTANDTAFFISAAKTIRFRPGINGLAVGPAGSEHFYINNANGFVGINTTDPKSRLQVGAYQHIFNIDIAGEHYALSGYNTYWNGASMTRTNDGSPSIILMGENAANQQQFSVYQYPYGLAGSTFPVNGFEYRLNFKNGKLAINRDTPAAGLHVRAPDAATVLLDIAVDNSRPELQIHGNSSYYTAVRAHDLLAADYTLTLPVDAGSSGQVLTTDGAGALSWGSNIANAIVDANADTYVHVEKTANDDLIRFNIAGNERMVLQDNVNGVPQLIFFGDQTLIGNSVGNAMQNTQQSNTAVGSNTLSSSTSGNGNTAIGSSALTSLTTGSGNVAIGFNTQKYSTTGDYNIGIGANAGKSTSGDANIHIGAFSGYNGVGVKTYTSIIAIGDSAGYDNEASDNIFIGAASGKTNSSGNQNVYVGNWSGKKGTSASRNAFVGWRAGYLNTIGVQNTFVGSEAGRDNSTADNNTFIGAETGRSTTTGNENTFVGATAGTKNTTGQNNTFVGYGTGVQSETGSNNVFVGDLAGRDNISGSGNVFIGSQAGLSETGSNKLYIDNSSTSAPLIYGDFATNQLTVNGDETVTGIQTAADFSYSTAKTHYISVPGVAFMPISASDVVVKSGVNMEYIYMSSGGFALAPIYLPDGANVQEVKMFFDTDVTNGSAIGIDLMLLGSNATTLGTASYIGAATAGITQANVIVSGGHVVDNLNNSYALKFTTPVLNSNVKLYRAVIRYTVTQPD